MSVVVVDGFDIYNGTGANTGLQAKWTLNNINGTMTNSMISGRYAGQAVRLQLTGTSTGLAGYQRTLPGTYGSITAGFAFRVSLLSQLTSTTNLPIIFQFIEGSTYHVHIGVQTDGKISAYRASSSIAGTLLGTSATQFIFNNTWHYIEVELVVSDTVGRVTIYVDGVQALNLTSQDTRNGGAAGQITVAGITCNAQSVGAGSFPSLDFDDMYILDAATKLGERKIETLYPTSDVNQGFTRSTGATNYTLVDEAQANGDTDYVIGNAVADRDTYGFGNLTNTPTTVDAVQFSAFAEKTDATARSIALQAISGATTSDGANFSLASSYGKFERIMLTDPNGSIAWTGANVDALTGGPKVTV